MKLTYLYGDIVKTEKTDDGLIVNGKATGPDLDIDKQICDPGWLAKAMPAWMEWGNVRESHTTLAAGVGMELTQDGADWQLKSLCVDPGTQKKLETGVLKGYSIGIKGARTVTDSQAPGGRIVGGEIVEISYVDRPANPTAKVTIAKSAGGGAGMEPIETAAKAAADIAATVKTLVPDLAKADDETSDIAGASQAIAIIARLIQSEAEGLAAGQLGEAYDIDCLLDAVRALRWFRENESLEDTTEGLDMDLTSLGVSADTIKAATADAATDETKDALRAEVRKALGLSDDLITKAALADTVKAAVADATKGVEDRLETLTATVTTQGDDLAVVKEMAAPGGAARTRSPHDTAKAAAIDRLAAERERYLHMASTVTDQDLAAGYRAKAAELDKDLAGITPAA